MKANLGVAVFLLVPFSILHAQQAGTQQKDTMANCAKECPMHNMQSQAGASHTSMEQRGEMGMGFSQTATTHHFFLSPDGGAIQVEVNDPKDTSNRGMIREHLAHVAQAFASGDFDIPMFVHDTTPPGVPEMKRLREKIKYSYSETPNGGRVLISTTDSDALSAVHQFLRFQIQEHKTGDPTDVSQ